MDSIPVRTTAPLPLPAITVKDPSAVNTRQSFVARVFATAGVVVSLLVLVGWTLDVPRLRALGSDMESQANPMSALLFALGGVALWLAATARPNKTRSVRALSLVVFGASIVCFIDAAGGYGIGIDQLLFGAALRGVTETSTPHITAVSAASLVLFALAMLALVHRAARVASAQTALLANLLLAGTALLAFLYRATWFDGIGATMRMARPSAFSLIFLSLGALFLRPREGLTRVVMSAGAGGRLARQLLFWGVVVPVVAGWALIRAYRSGIVTMDVAIMLIVLATVVMLVMLTGWQATIVHDSLEERARTEDALRDSEVRFRLLAENASDVVSLHDLDGQILYISPSCERVFGFTPDEMARLRPLTMVHPEDRAKAMAHHEALVRGEPVTALTCRKLHKSGRHVWVETSWRPILNRAGKIIRLQAASRDVTERREYERQLEEVGATLRVQQDRLLDANSRLEALASLDSLTGLKNRRAFEERLHEEIARARRSQEPFALLLLDIDHFKNFNDSFGHPRGDDVLKSVARVLSRSVRDADFIARYGGEEFAIILPDTDRDGAKLMGERLRVAIEENAWDVRPITMSVGAAAWTDASTAESLVDQADRALYRSKQAGRNIVTLAEAA